MIPGWGTKIPHAPWSKIQNKSRSSVVINATGSVYTGPTSDFPGGTVGRKPPAEAGDTRLIPGPGGFPGLCSSEADVQKA